MDDLTQCPLDELIERVLRERLIDACERRGDEVVIIQGPARFVLSPKRAHAFLRGVIKGMSAEYRRSPWSTRDADRTRRRDSGALPGDLESSEDDLFDLDNRSSSTLENDLPHDGLIDSFRRHLLKKWWRRYHAAGCPFGRSSIGLMLWIRHNTFSTTN